jgi:hypothetical protein
MVSVIWTDFIQSIAILIVAAVTLGVACHLSGGFGHVFQILRAHNMTVGKDFFGWHPFTPASEPVPVSYTHFSVSTFPFPSFPNPFPAPVYSSLQFASCRLQVAGCSLQFPALSSLKCAVPATSFYIFVNRSAHLECPPLPQHRETSAAKRRVFSSKRERRLCSTHAVTQANPPGSTGFSFATREGPAEDFWAMSIGVTVTSIAQSGADQLAVQRWLTVTDVKAAQLGVSATKSAKTSDDVFIVVYRVPVTVACCRCR